MKRWVFKKISFVATFRVYLFAFLRCLWYWPHSIDFIFHWTCHPLDCSWLGFSSKLFVIYWNCPFFLSPFLPWKYLPIEFWFYWSLLIGLLLSFVYITFYCICLQLKLSVLIILHLFYIELHIRLTYIATSSFNFLIPVNYRINL